MKLVTRLNPVEVVAIMVYIVYQGQCYSNNITKFYLQDLVRRYFFDGQDPTISYPGHRLVVGLAVDVILLAAKSFTNCLVA
jgi:hypothetical protein